MFTWRLEPGNAPVEQVTVQFEARGSATEVIIVHERIASEQAREQHQLGWQGCLTGLSAYV